MAFFIQWHFTETHTVLGCLQSPLGLNTVYSIEQSFNSPTCQHINMGTIMFLFRYQTVFANIVQNTRLVWMTTTQQPSFRSIRWEHRSWKRLPIKGWQIIKLTEKKPIENCTYRQWTEPNSPRIEAIYLLIWPYWVQRLGSIFRYADTTHVPYSTVILFVLYIYEHYTYQCK